MEKQEFAMSQFLDGYRCSQAVLESFAEESGLDPDLARRISIGLAGGAGCGGKCGAVEAAYLVNGLRYGYAHPGDPEKFKKVIDKNIEFTRRFQEMHTGVNCRDLIGVDLFSEEGYRYFQENNVKSKTCVHFVKDAVRILQEIK